MIGNNRGTRRCTGRQFHGTPLPTMSLVVRSKEMVEGFLRIFLGMVAGLALLGAILGVAFAKQNR